MAAWSLIVGSLEKLLPIVKMNKNKVALFVCNYLEVLEERDIQGIPIVPVRRILQNQIQHKALALALNSEEHHFKEEQVIINSGIGRWPQTSQKRDIQPHRDNKPVSDNVEKELQLAFGMVGDTVKEFMERDSSLGFAANFTGGIELTTVKRTVLNGVLNIKRIGKFKTVATSLRVLQHKQNVITKVTGTKHLPVYKNTALFIREVGTEKIARILAGDPFQGVFNLWPLNFEFSKPQPVIDILTPDLESKPCPLVGLPPRIIFSSFEMEPLATDTIHILTHGHGVYCGNDFESKHHPFIPQVDAICLY